MYVSFRSYYDRMETVLEADTGFNVVSLMLAPWRLNLDTYLTQVMDDTVIYLLPVRSAFVFQHVPTSFKPPGVHGVLFNTRVILLHVYLPALLELPKCIKLRCFSSVPAPPKFCHLLLL